MTDTSKDAVEAVAAAPWAFASADISATLRALSAERDAATNLVQYCTIDLRGAGYHCLERNGDVCFGIYGEGDLVLCEGSKVTAIGLHILGPVALAEKIDAAVLAERERCAAWVIASDLICVWEAAILAEGIRKGPTP